MATLTEQELRQVRDYVIRILPDLLREEPEIATTIEGILARQFPRRDEFAHLLDELTLLREQAERRLERVEQRLDLLQEEMERRFEQAEQRLNLLREEMERRFEQVDRRLNLLREEMERRFEQVDQRLDLQREEITLLREEMERRFEQVDQHLDLQREEIALLREEMERRFEQVDQRLDLQHQEILEPRRGVAQLQHGQEMSLRRMDGQEAWLRLVIGELRAEKGRTLEDLFAEALRYGLKNPDIQPESLRLRQKLVDRDGQVFKPGYATEVDLIAEDDELTVFEVKATPEAGDVDLLAMKVELMALQNPDKAVQGVLITLVAPEEVRQRCAEHGLELVD